MALLNPSGAINLWKNIMSDGGVGAGSNLINLDGFVIVHVPKQIHEQYPELFMALNKTACEVVEKATAKGKRKSAIKE